MATFHPFPRLPLELRFVIWEISVEPREVEIRIAKPTPEDSLAPTWSRPNDWGRITEAKFDEAMSHVPTSTRAGRKARKKAREQWKPYHPYVHLASSSIPAVLHACREARNHGLYQQVYLDGDDQPRNDRRYVWLNLDIDLINIGTWDMTYFLPIASSIKRLKLTRRVPDEFQYEMDLLPSFINAEEVHLVCYEGFTDWGDEVDRFDWPCAKANMVFIDENPWFLGVPVVGRLEVGYRELKRLFREYWSAANSEFYNADYWGEDYGYVD